MKNFYSTLPFIILGFLLVPATLSASPISFSINPQKFQWDIFPGESFQRKISITNRSDVAIPFSARTLTFDAAEDTGQMIFMPLGDLENSPGMWFRFQTPDFILEPQEKRELSFSINIPEDAKPGGYSAFILFEPRLPDHYFAEGSQRTIPAIGAPILISVRSFYLDPEPKDELEIVEFSLSKEERLVFLETIFGAVEGSLFQTVQASTVQAVGRKPQSFNLRVRNNSDFHLKPRGTAVIKNIFGATVGEIEIPEKTILPGKIRIFPVELSPTSPARIFGWLPDDISEYLSEKIFAGRYRVELDLSSPHLTGPKTLEARVSEGMILYSLPWVTVVFVLSILFLLLFLIAKHHRVKFALKALFKKPKG